MDAACAFNDRYFYAGEVAYLSNHCSTVDMVKRQERCATPKQSAAIFFDPLRPLRYGCVGAAGPNILDIMANNSRAWLDNKNASSDSRYAQWDDGHGGTNGMGPVRPAGQPHACSGTEAGARDGRDRGGWGQGGCGGGVRAGEEREGQGEAEARAGAAGRVTCVVVRGWSVRRR